MSVHRGLQIEGYKQKKTRVLDEGSILYESGATIKCSMSFVTNTARNWCPSPVPDFSLKEEGGSPVGGLPTCPGQLSKSEEYVKNPTKFPNVNF